MITGLYILIPAKNEAHNIEKVINKFKKFGKIIVINDCSSDKTFEISKKNCTVLNNSKPLGYDFSLRKGINFIKKKKNSKYILTVDGDDQHPLVNLKKIIYYMKNYDLIIFNRYNLQRTAEYIVHYISEIFFRIKDPLSGMKLYKVSNLKQNYTLDKKTDYIGMFFMKIYNKKKIFNIEIKTKKKIKTSFGNGFIINLKILKAFIKCL